MLLLPLAWLLARVSLGAVWYAFPLAEIASLALAIFFFAKQWRERIKPLQEQSA